MEETTDGHQTPPEDRFLDSFLLEPLFIIGVLVLTVVIIILITHYMNRNEPRPEGDVSKTVVFTDNNLQTVTVLLDNIGDSIDIGTLTENALNATEGLEGVIVMDEDGLASDQIMTIMPQKSFRAFPRNEEDQMKKRRDAMLRMLALPPLA